MSRKVSLPLAAVLAGTALATISGAATAFGQTNILFVDTNLSSASCTNYSPFARACANGTNVAYRSVSGAAAVAGPGTIVLIRGGTYNEQLRPAFSGAPGSSLTFKNYAAEAVYLTGSPAMNISDRNCLVIEGLRAEGTTWLEARNAHSNLLRRCIFKRTPAVGTTGNVRFIQSHYNRIVENTIEDGHDNLLLIDSNFNVVQGNTITEARHSIFGIRCGDYNVIRSNYFSNTQQKIGEVYDCGVDTSAVPHSYNSTKHNVIERNVFAQTSTYYSTSGGNGIQYAGQEGIIRNNVFYHCNVGLGMQVYADEALCNVKNRIYNNVFYANHGAGIALRPGTTNNLYKNNVLFGNQGCIAGDCTGISAGQIVYRLPLDVLSRFESNDIIYQTPNQSVFEEEFGLGRSLAAFTNLFPNVFVNTLESNPKFVDAEGYDFRPQPGSALIDAGTFLTRTASSGNGTHVPVEDTSWFYGGFDLPSEAGDSIQIEGQAATARIVQVDRSNGILFLDQPLTWNAGQGVALPFNGERPDIGAFEAGSPAPRLKISHAANSIVLSWPLAFGEYRVQSTGSMNATNWTFLPDPSALSNEWVVSNIAASTSGFFRLVK